MAKIEHEWCEKCFSTTRHVNRKCSDCVEREYMTQVLAWNLLPVEKRLNDLRERIEKLEKGPDRY